MGQNQVKNGDEESPENTPFLADGGGDGEKPSSDPTQNPLNFPLHLAASSGDLEKVKELLDGSDSDVIKYSVTDEDEKGRTPLHCATLPTSSSPNQVSVIKLLLQRDKDNPSSQAGKPLLLLTNLKDASKKTALHYAAASQERKVVSLLLKNGADPSVKDDEGSTPLHILAKSNSASALCCAEYILNADSSAGSETNAKGQTVVHVATKSKASKLLKLFVDRESIDIVRPGDRGLTPLMVAAKAKNGDSEENLECVKILLEAYPREQVNAKEKEWGQTAVHMATLHERVKILELFDSSSKTDLFAEDNHKQTVFHYAIYRGSLPAVKFLCDCEQMSDKDKLVEIVFQSHKSSQEDFYNAPIAIALQRNYTKIVDYLLAAHPNQDQWMSDEVLMSTIYSEHPTALLLRMSDSLKSGTMWGLKEAYMDFRIITGAKDPVKLKAEETKYLYQINNAQKREQSEILLHPLVQIFLKEKWERIRELTWIHIILQLAWILSYSMMVYEMYAPNCHNTDRANKTEATEGKGSSGGGGGAGEGEEVGKGHMRILTSLGFLEWEEDCKFNQTAVQVTALMLYLLSALVLAKEVVQMIIKSYSYFLDFINFVQLGILVAAVVNSAPAWHSSSASEAAPWQTNLAAIGIFVSWVMLLSELDNFPKCAVYSAILKTVLWNCLKTMLFYCPLLIGFAMCLRLLSPGIGVWPVLKSINSYFVVFVGKAQKGQHKYLLFSLIKVVAMMTGELEFEDAFYGDDITSGSGPSTAYTDILGQVMTLLLVFVTTIVLINLLTGLAVADVGSLLKEADAHRLSTQLERMYMFEGFVLWARQKLAFLDSWENLLYRLNVTGIRDEDEKKYVHSAYTTLNLKDYPEELMAGILDVMGESKEK